MKYPKKLINSMSFIAPSFGCVTSPYKERLDSALKKLNYDIKVYDNCYKSELPYRSNTKELCAKEFMDAYCDHNDVIISVGGGEYMVEILDSIDFELLKTLEPKWFMGYSDNTNLTFLLPTICDVATIYGPTATYFGIEEHQSIRDSLSLLKGENYLLNSYGYYEDVNTIKENPLEGFSLNQKSNYYINKVTEVKGRLIGGCLDVILNLVGTKYDYVANFLEKYKDDGFIWFLEACDLNVMSVKRGLKQLENAGYFKYVKSFIIGRSYNNEEMFSINSLDAYLEILEKYNVLIVGNADIGHVKPSMPLITGAIATLTTTKEDYSIKMELK